VNGVGDIDERITIVAATSFFTSIADTYDRFAVGREG
jgi:hypothetical protein